MSTDGSGSLHSTSSSNKTGSSRHNKMLYQTQEIPIIPANLIDSLNNVTLGKGTYGIVEKTKYRKTPNDEYIVVAVKYPTETRHLKNLIQEAKAMMSLRSHKNVTKIYGIHESPKYTKGIVLEYMDCKSMAHLLQNKNIKYTIDHFASWMYQLSSAVEFFHSNDTLHRDLKTQNMLLSNRYRTLKVCDFGTFTSLKDTMTGNLGTPITMAPEVFRAEKNYTQKSDIYSIGIIMWQIIARDEPYNNAIESTSLLFHVASNNLRPCELNCSYILSGFYKRCWDGDTDVRPTASECKQYFGYLGAEYPNRNEPLFDETTNREVLTPQPHMSRSSLKPSPFGTNGSSRGHRRTGSDQTTMLNGNVPSPLVNGPGMRDNRSKSVASSLFTATNTDSSAGSLSPARPAYNTSCSQELKQMWETNPNLQPIEPDIRDGESLNLYNQQCQECETLLNILGLRQKILSEKHDLLAKWSKAETNRQYKNKIENLKMLISHAESATSVSRI